MKLVVENSKKNNLSNYSNGKNEKDKINNLNNNNSSTHKSKKNNHNINYYYSNTKNRYIYYKNNINNNSSVKKEYDKYDISKEHKDISANLSFITITDTYNLNSQKKKEKRNNNIKLIDNTVKKNIMSNQKDIDNYQNKNNNFGKNRLSHIKYNSCINAKITNINLYDEKSFGVKKEINTSHKPKHHIDKENNLNNNNNNNLQNYNTNTIINKQKKHQENKNIALNNNNIIIKINLVSRKLDSINRNRLFQRHVKKSNEGIIKKIKINNYNIIKRKETSKRKRIDSNVSSCHYKNNNSSLIVNNNKSNDKNEKNNSDGYKHKNDRNYNINYRYNFDKRGRNYSMISQKKLKNSNSLM